jgi:hypothetical protein
MSNRGLSSLIVTIMAVGEVDALPALDQRRLHEALASLVDEDAPAAERLWLRYGGRPATASSPAIPRAVHGVRPALWEAVRQQLLTAHEYPDGSGEYRLTEGQAAAARRGLLRLPADEAALVHRVGASWALRSTSRNNVASAEASPAATRRARLA